MRNRSENDPRMIRPHTRPSSHPSHRRGRSSTFGDGLCMEKHRLSCICYLSKTHFVRDFLQNSIGNSSTSTTCNPIYSEGTILELQITMGIPSATHPPAPLATLFTMRERSYSCKSQWNSVDHTCTKNSWNPIYNAEPIREWSENIREWSDHTRRPSRTRRTAEVDHRRSGTDFVWKNIGFRASAIWLSCICYLSKTHFVRDFLQNSIGNSSTSTTCNPIYSEGTILELQITMEFHQQLIHQHHLQPHLQCGNDPTVANHNGILSTTHARKTVETPFTMRNRSENDPRISENDPTTHETVSHPSAPQR